MEKEPPLKPPATEAMKRGRNTRPQLQPYTSKQKTSSPRKNTRDKQASQRRYRKNGTLKIVADINKATASLLHDSRTREPLFHPSLEILYRIYPKEIKY